MIDQEVVARPIGTRSVAGMAAGFAETLQAGAEAGSSALGRLAVWLAKSAEPLLDWLAHRRWLGRLFGSLVGKIVALNLFGLAVLTGLNLIYSPVQASLVQAKLESMISESEIIAATIATTATRESDRVNVAPDLMEPGFNAELKQAMSSRPLQFPLRPERIAKATHGVFDGTGMRIRVFRIDGALMYDSETLADVSQASDAAEPGPITTFWTWFIDQTDGTELPVYKDVGRSKASAYPEFQAALGGKSKAVILVGDRGRRTVTMITPIKLGDTLTGVQLLSTRDGEIDKLVWAERKTVLWLGGFGLLVMAITSLLLAGTIALPLRQLSRAAEGVQRNLRRREDLPNLAYRGDEVAHLSTTLRNMTEALYKRVEASERFAADVAHELKNPLTSVRSAAETLPMVRNEADRKLLTDTIQNDVKRLTRLIDDISKATRADAEMALNDAEPVDLSDLVKTLTEMFNNVHVRDSQQVVSELMPAGMPLNQAYLVQGHDIRLGQVFKNLLDNALSFSPPQGRAWIKAKRNGDVIQIAIEDEGPGIPPGNMEKIFNRFYTDRPVAAFGNNSGLGLSICKEIVNAHGGRIWAENRTHTRVQKTGTSDLGVVSSTIDGARFVVELPAAIPEGSQSGQRGGRVRAYGRR